MIDILCLGSLTLDLFFQDNSLTIKKDRFNLALGGKYVTEKFSQGLGGGGGNIAVGLARANIKTALWSEIGDSGVGLLIRSRLKEEKVDCELLQEKTGLVNLSTILLSQKGERTIINHRSHSLDIQFTRKVKEILKTVKIFYLGNMPEMSIDTRVEVVQYAHNHNIQVALNLGVKDCRRRLKNLSALFENIDFLIVNRYELADILNISPSELSLRQINYHLKVKLNEKAILIVTDGEFGSFAYSKDQIFYQKAIQVKKVIDTTGAGDAFTSGFLAGQFYKKTLVESLSSGARNSSSVIQVINAQEGLLSEENLFSA